MPTGLLLVNLGTPDQPTSGAVRRYLRQFLSDPRVIDMNPVGRWLLLNLIILPLRPRKSAHAYRQIWNAERGSPLLFLSEDLAAGVAERLGDAWHVELAMRYGSPSIPRALARMREAGVDRIVVFPLFPQYASSTTGSAVAEVFRVAGAEWNVPILEVVPPFWHEPGFLDAFAQVVKPGLRTHEPDHVLFSFHGLPERHITKSDETGHCRFDDGCCAQVGPDNRHCYRAQCYATARGIAERLGLDEDRWTVTFQSRLGRVPWLQPYTDRMIEELGKAGIKRLAVVCPAFVADCLETLEEIGLRGRATFLAAGGEFLALIRSLNAHDAWADTVAELARRHAHPAADAARPALRVVE